MRHGSLFSGIGGFDLAAEWMGWQNIFHCEWNDFGKRVLKHYWPNATTYHDITQTDFSVHRGTIDVLTGGFPCQPYSMSGKRLGKEDERHLWPEMLRAVREIQPRWIVGENVFGLVNWSGGLVFNEVQADLEAEGYEVQTYVLPACAVNAPHRRDRVWFVAYSKSDGRQKHTRSVGCEIQEKKIRGNKSSIRIMYNGEKRSAPDTERIRLPQCEQQGQPRCGQQRTSDITTSSKQHCWNHSAIRPGSWNDFPTQSPICSRNDGLSAGLDGITFPRWRNESIKAGGNAIVPQVALQIFKTIAEYERVK